MLGSNGVIGNGIALAFRKYNIEKINSSSYNYATNEFKLKKFKKCDYFIHAAGVTEEEIAKYGSIKSLKRASVATRKLLKHIIKLGCKNIIYISSLRVYSEKATILDEDKTNLQTNDKYKLCHIVSENIFKKLAKQYKINFLILRPGAVYGFAVNRYKFNRLKLIPYSFPISLFINNKITLKSSGVQMRNFISNIDIGNRVYNWVKNKNKKSVLSNISGDKTCNVKEFSYLCAKIYTKIFKKKASIEIPINTKKNLKKKN